MSLDETTSDDLIDELEYRGYVVIDKESYDDVLEQFKQWKDGGKA